jgi:dienelactone hydrolase
VKTPKFFLFLSLVAFLIVAIGGCNGAEPTAPPPTPPTDTPPPPTATPEVVEPEVMDPTATNPPPTEALPTEAPPTEPPAPTEAPPLPAEAQQIEFQAADGQALQGVYYPAAINPAPIVVLMHWAPGDQNDWIAIAGWLQNRGATDAVSGAGAAPWLDPSWFPLVLEELPVAVFTFTFRGCEGGCSSFQPEGWLLDAKAAVETAKGLPAVDPDRLIAIGASIGADGAVDACEEGCLGGLSLSPGSYLGLAYDEVVTTLDEADKPVWCLAAELDQDSANACQSASGDHYRMIIYPDDPHGLELVKPGMDPETLEVILEFLQLVLG